MNTIVKTPEPPVILDRNQVASMNDMYKRTFPGPWKVEVLKNYGLKHEDAEFITMIHARFPDFVNTVLALTTKVEQLEISNLDAMEVEDDLGVRRAVDNILKSLPKPSGDGLDHENGEESKVVDLGPLPPSPEKRKRGRPRKVVEPRVPTPFENEIRNSEI